jgi:hypothetical protein
MDSCTFPLSLEAKQAVLDKIFDYKVPLQDIPQIGECYFHYYQKSIESCGYYGRSESRRDIWHIVGLLKRPDATRVSVETTLREQLLGEEHEDSAEIIHDSINLAVQLLLMIPIGAFTTLGGVITVSGETNLYWKQGTITELVSTEISSQTQMKEHIRLDKPFNARNLKRIAGIEIRWTTNLADHLRMRDDDTAVEIFHCASFLRFHKKW